MGSNDRMMKGRLLTASMMTPIERARGRFLRAPDHDAGTGGGDGGQGGDGQGGGAGSAADFLGGAGDGGADGGQGGQGGQGGDGGAGDGGQGGQGGDGGDADPDWYQQLSVETQGEEPSLRDWAKSRGYKTLDDVVKSARDNQKALRDSGRIKVPGEGATAEEVATFHEAIGVPKDAKGYKLPELKNEAGEPLLGKDGEPLQLNAAKLERITANAHKAGIPAKALEAVLQAEAEADLQEIAAAEAEINRRAGEHAKKWGDKAAENTANINAASRALGLTRDEVLAVRAAWGPERALDVFAKLGAGISEDTMVDGGSRVRFGISGAEAQKQLDERMSSQEWSKKAVTAGTPENAEYKRLLAAVTAEADRRAPADA